MIYCAIFLFIGSAFLASVLYIIHKADDSEGTIPTAIIGALIFALVEGGIAILQEVYNSSIKPMDVYQGKTTLKYEVVDGVNVDSTVVWKENTYEQD